MGIKTKIVSCCHYPNGGDYDDTFIMELYDVIKEKENMYYYIIKVVNNRHFFGKI